MFDLYSDWHGGGKYRFLITRLVFLAHTWKPYKTENLYIFVTVVYKTSRRTEDSPTDSILKGVKDCKVTRHKWLTYLAEVVWQIWENKGVGWQALY